MTKNLKLDKNGRGRGSGLRNRQCLLHFATGASGGNSGLKLTKRNPNILYSGYYYTAGCEGNPLEKVRYALSGLVEW